MPINAIGIITLFIVFLNIVLGVIVYFKNPKRANNVVYAISVFSIALWALFTFFYNNPVILKPDVWLKIVYLSSYGMLIAQLMFAYFFPKKVKSGFWSYAIPILIFLVPSFYVLMIENSVVISAIHFSKEYISIAKMGPGYLVYTLPNILGILLIGTYFFLKSRKFIGYEKAQVHFYILGALLMMIPLVVVDYGIPLLTGETKYFVYGPLFAIPFSIALAYSILKNRFLTIKVVLRNSFFSVLTLIYAILGILFFVDSYEQLFSTDLNNRYLNIAIFTAIAIGIYQFIYRPLVNLFLNIFSKDKRNRDEILNNFMQVSNIELTIDRIAINVKRTIKQLFMIERVGIMLFDKGDYSIRYKYLDDFKEISPEYLLQIVRNWSDVSLEKVLVSDEFKRKMILEESGLDKRLQEVIGSFGESEISTVIPFNSRTQFDGVLLLGYRVDKYPLSIEDIELVEKISDSVSVSIGRAVLYQEVQLFNRSLRERVNEQTKELQIKIQELEEARRKEADMIDIMGHELRTPATVAKLNVEFLEKYIDSNPEEFKKYLGRVKSSIDTEIGLINTLLTSAKLEGNKVEIRHSKVDIKSEIEMVVDGHGIEAQEKGIKLLSQVDNSTPYVYADRVRVIEILNNLISNAIKYTHEGRVLISTEYDNDFVKICVADTGKGIPQEDISKLGGKFYRINNYLGSEIVRPGGTGLGLYVTFGLVRLMGGEINVDSELDRGSRFTITLPIYRNQKIESIDSTNMFEKLGLKK
ncbi:MAG: ATP-binding protein [Candidatus Dojkabacteria bacterium]